MTLRPANPETFWPYYAARIPLFPPHRQAIMRRVLAENVGEGR